MKKIVIVLLMILTLLALAFPVQAADSKEIVINGGFEDGDTGWGVYDETTALIETSGDQAHTGESSMYISEKTVSHGGVVQDMTAALNFYKAGKYRVSAWLYVEDGEDAGKCSFTFRTTNADGEDAWKLSNQTQLKAGEWVQITGEVELKWEGDLSYGEIYFWFPNEDSSFSNYYLDDVSIVKVGYTGADFVPPTPSPEPTATPSPAPTPTPTASSAKTTAPNVTSAKTTAPGATAAPQSTGAAESGSMNIPLLVGIGLLMSVGGALLGGGGVYLTMKKKQVKANEE